MSQWVGEDRRSTKWHLKREVSVGHIISTASFIAMMTAWGISVEKRLVVLETTTASQNERANRTDLAVNESFKDIKSALIRIENRLNAMAGPK
jgi:hypothetical protein